MAPSRRNPALWPLAVLSLLLIGVPVVAGVRDALRDAAPPIGVGERVDAYRIVYLVENVAAGGTASSTEIVTVMRPFAGRVVTRAGPPPGGEVLSVEVSNFAARQHDGAPGEASVVTVEPSPPEGDLRLDATFDTAVDRGLLTPQGDRHTVAGRRCDVYRIDVLSPSGQDEGDARDLCIDAAGLPMVDELVVDGKVLRRRTAVSVRVGSELDPAPDPADFDLTGTRVHVDDGGGAIRAVTSDSRNPDTTVYELTTGPLEFRHRGRYVLTPAAPTAEAAGIAGETRVVGVIDVWERGPNFVAVFNGGADNAADPFRDDPRARTIDLGAFRAETVVTLTGHEVRADLGKGRFVRVFGTVPLAQLVALARQLEPVTGGEIIPIEPLP